MRKKHREKQFLACLLVHGAPTQGKLISGGMKNDYDELVMNWYKHAIHNDGGNQPKRQTCFRFLREFTRWYKEQYPTDSTKK